MRRAAWAAALLVLSGCGCEKGHRPADAGEADAGAVEDAAPADANPYRCELALECPEDRVSRFCPAVHEHVREQPSCSLEDCWTWLFCADPRLDCYTCADWSPSPWVTFEDAPSCPVDAGMPDAAPACSP